MAKEVKKPWGSELVWALTPHYAGKLLVIEAGQRLSLQKHVRKDESIYVLRGALLLQLADEAGVLRERTLAPGEFARIPCGRVHRFAAGDARVEVMEVSTPELDDVVRLADDYGRAPK